MIRETCSCGATLDIDQGQYMRAEEIKAAADWRQGHQCAEPATVLAEVHDSGPGLADVTERLTTISEHVALIGRILAVKAK